MGTSPKLIDAGSTETAAAVVELPFWLKAAFGPLAIPVQPETERKAKSAKTKSAKGIGLLPIECSYGA